MIGIVCVSHGRMAEGMEDSAKLFYGEEIENMKTVCLMPEESPDGFEEKLRQAVEESEQGDGVVILCDLLFGTPCNRAAGIMSDQVKVICGMNMPVLLELLGRRSAVKEDGTMPKVNELDWKEILKLGQEGLCDLAEKLKI